MKVIARSTLREFWEVHPDSEQALSAWFQKARASDWRGPAEVKAAHLSASILRDNRVVFKIQGNRYRLVVRINYRAGVVYVRLVGTHADYDAIDAQTI